MGVTGALRQHWRMGLILAALCAVGLFLYYSSRLAAELAEQERERMEIWAEATRRLAADSTDTTDVDFLLTIVETNRTIPIILTDSDGKIILHRNFSLPEDVDPLRPLYISPANELFLRERLEYLRHTPRVIIIEIAPGMMQRLYYDDSRLLKRLSYYPYVQMLIMAAFVAMVYFAVTASRKAEQNKVWVGLSKETAHQLGTPISSLMAWTEYLRADGHVAEDVVDDMEKDVNRLASIASRFSKIGSRPGLQPESVGKVLAGVVAYMQKRVSPKVEWSVTDTTDGAEAQLSAPLLEWVLENLIKNAVDAMDGHGKLTISATATSTHISVEITDTGRGISRRDFKRIFKPGFTTKQRGWGLGLTLARRIVETYHGGRIYVRASEPMRGTTFRIDLPRTFQPTTLP